MYSDKTYESRDRFEVGGGTMNYLLDWT